MDKKHIILHGNHCHVLGNGYIESIVHMILEHCDTEEYHNTLFVMWPAEEWHDEDIYYKEFDYGRVLLDTGRMHETYDKIIFYDLEHSHDCHMPWMYPDWLGTIDEIRTPWMENLSCYDIGNPDIPVTFMPLRYCKFLEDKHIRMNGSPYYDAGFFGTQTPYRQEVLRPVIANPLVGTDKRGYYVSGINQYEIPNILANTKFIINLDQKWRKLLRSQNVVRICEAICLGRTVISDKSTFNYFKGMVVEMDNPFEDLTDTIANTFPKDHSFRFREMTYQDEDYEQYKKILASAYRRNVGGFAPPIISNPKFECHKPL